MQRGLVCHHPFGSRHNPYASTCSGSYERSLKLRCNEASGLLSFNHKWCCCVTFARQKKSTVNGKPRNSEFFFAGSRSHLPSLVVSGLQFVAAKQHLCNGAKQYASRAPDWPCFVETCKHFLLPLQKRHYNVPLFAVHDFTLSSNFHTIHHSSSKWESVVESGTSTSPQLATNCSITKWLWVEAASIRTSYSSPGCWVFMVTWARVQSFESLRS